MTATRFESPETQRIYATCQLDAQLRDRLPIHVDACADHASSILATLDIATEDVSFFMSKIGQYLMRGTIVAIRVSDDPNHDSRLPPKQWCYQLTWNGRR